MKKNNNLGFMLTETLIVSSFISVVLLYMFVNFRKTYQYYEKTFTYNTVNSLYATNHIKKYIMSNEVDYGDIKNTLEGATQYKDLTDCSGILFQGSDYCKKLLENLEVEKVYFTKNDISNLASFMKSGGVDERIITFLDYVKYDKLESGYRLIVFFKDETIATLKMEEGN